MSIDHNTADWVTTHIAPDGLITDFTSIMALAFRIEPVTALLFILALLTWWRRERLLAAWIIASALANPAINWVLKEWVARARPDERLIEAHGFSFPSGHADRAGVLATVLILLTIAMTGRGWRRRILLTVWVLIGVSSAGSRVLLNVHYTSDVIGGLALGTGVTLAGWVVIAQAAIRVPADMAALTGSGLRRAAVIWNPAKVTDPDVFASRLRAAAGKYGWAEPLWFETSVDDPGAGQAQAALESGVALLIVAGGAGRILPHETGKLLARNLDMPLNIKDAIDTVFSGQDHAIDLASISTDTFEHQSFMVMAGLGMDAAIMTGVNDGLKQRVGW